MNENESVSYFVLEGIMTHFTLMVKRLFVLCIALLVALLFTIAGFLWYISLPIEESETVRVESDGGYANYVGNDVIGGINNGESKSDN